jgi:uncharacterized protein YjbJ (UPF0337 family)
MSKPSDPGAAKGGVAADSKSQVKAQAPAARTITNIVRRVRSLPSGTELKGRWKQRIGAARIAWSRLTEDELVKIEGHEQKLSGLIQRRYAITRNEAVEQVRAFFSKHRT